jgi:hypothetical protein
LRRVEISQCNASLAPLWQGILSLESLHHLTVDCSVFLYAVLDLPAFPMPSLTSLTLKRSEIRPHPDNLYPLIDILHHFSKLRTLTLFSRAARPFFERLLANSSPPLPIDTLIIKGTTGVDFALIQEFFKIHGSGIQRLSFHLPIQGRLLTDLEPRLPSLRSFRGQLGVAETWVTPEVEEMHLTTEYSSMHIAMHELKKLPLNPSTTGVEYYKRLYHETR